MICDPYDRPVLNLRISLTQKCDKHCPYCHREGERNPTQLMSVEEILRIVRVAISLGISRVKLTGGEPLMRPEIVQIVKGITSLEGLTDLSLTSNGAHLKDYAKDLKAAGLNRVNVSLPSLDPKVYNEVMGGDLEEILAGIRAAVDAGLKPVKLNMLVLKGINDHEVEKMIQFAAETGTILQMIELEPINLNEEYYRRHHLDLDVIAKKLEKLATDVTVREFMQNRRVYILPNVKVELIRPIENTEFCANCTRLRVTSDGKLKPCLMRTDNLVDLLTPLRNGADDEKLKEIFLQAVKLREPFYKAAKTAD
ncbi:MAG: GTP 3',8-cyclase MoaA [Candidatus Bathyarchaeota archaeon]|nr:GTP 3',8-cyclase MoaA [Candidatus Bathyarchaeota archaeon]